MSAAAATTSTTPVVWSSIDPRNSSEVKYSNSDITKIERAFQAGEKSIALKLGGNDFTITFKTMKQTNSSGGSRSVKRTPAMPQPVAATTMLPPLTASLLRQALEVAKEADAQITKIIAEEANREFNIPGRFIKDDSSAITVFAHMIDEFASSHEMRSLYGYHAGEDDAVINIDFGEQVPNYFANAVEQSIFQRKVLSMLGLRNLIRKGPLIFKELRAKLFSGNPEDYPGGEGLAKMRHFTGNTVDLDTPLLKAHEQAQLVAVNAMRAKEGKAPFASSEELATSPDTHAMVFNLARQAIADFVDQLKLTPAEVQRRHLALGAPGSEGAMPQAQGYQDRGKWPVWYYCNVGIMSYHANVPNLPDVYGALLKAPFHLLRAYCETKLLYEGGKAMRDATAAFFEDAVSDSCFNGKWKAIEEFLKVLAKKGTIADVLDNVQREKQQELAIILRDDDDARTKETAWMKRVAVDGALRGRDASTGAIRAITADDVDAWIRATSA